MISKKVKTVLEKLIPTCTRCHGTGKFHVTFKTQGVEKCYMKFMPTCMHCNGSGKSNTKDRYEWPDSTTCTLERFLKRKNKKIK